MCQQRVVNTLQLLARVCQQRHTKRETHTERERERERERGGERKSAANTLQVLNMVSHQQHPGSVIRVQAPFVRICVSDLLQA
jgi:hypothetical protein